MNSLYLLTAFLLSILTHTSFAQSHDKQPYVFNRLALKQDVNVQLPLGSIKAKGWLLKQLELQKDGFTGHAEELYAENDNLGKDADWLGGQGNSWEKAPYYLKGLVALAYTLDDAELKSKCRKWLDYILDHQQESGLFGPPKMKDWWPRMPMVYALQSYYEATNDKRVIPFLSKYFKFQLANLDQDPLKEWGKARAGDNMEVALWLYNQTGESHLLDLVRKLKAQAYPWEDIFHKNQFFYYGRDFHTKHAVNVAQALKFPAVYSQLDSSRYYTNAMQNGITHLMHEHGLPQGLAAGTEFLSGKSAVQGVETCTVVEWMQSLETAARIIHDGHIGDQLEKIAFNALPAQFSKDLKHHTYYTLPNQVQSLHGPHGFNQDYENGILPGPYSGFPCCRYNLHMGWPYYVKNSWCATPEGGLAVNAYGPMEVNAMVAKNIPVKIKEVTNYPFEEEIVLTISLNQPVSFPLELRIPSWCLKPDVSINGKSMQGVKSGEIFIINRLWTDTDKIILRFPMHVVVQKQVNNAVSIERGPLVYALKITPSVKILKEFSIKGFYEAEVSPVSPWNYGLVLNPHNLNKDVSVFKRPMPDQPFDAQQSPIQLKMKAKRIPDWTIDRRKTAAFDVPYGPVVSNEKLEEVTLVPFGSEDLRVSIFPTIGRPDFESNVYSENFDNNRAEGLVIYGGAWYYRNNAIHTAPNEDGRSGPGTKIIATATKFSDFVYSADIAVGSAGDAGLLFRVNHPAIGSEAYEGYYVGLNSQAGTVELGKSRNGRWVVVANIKYPVAMNESYSVKVKAVGDKFEVYINGDKKPVLTTTDNEFKTGSVGLRAYNALATVDNLQVLRLSTK